MHGRISPRRACNPCGYRPTMKISSMYRRLLIYDVKPTTCTKIDGMGPFKQGALTIILNSNIQLIYTHSPHPSTITQATQSPIALQNKLFLCSSISSREKTNSILCYYGYLKMTTIASLLDF